METTDRRETTEAAAIAVPPDGGAAVWLLGDTYTLKIAGEQTGGAFALLEAVVPPGSGPPPHEGNELSGHTTGATGQRWRRRMGLMRRSPTTQPSGPSLENWLRESPQYILPGPAAWSAAPAPGETPLQPASGCLGPEARRPGC